MAAPSWTLSRDLYGVATSSWTLSRGYFELVFVATSSWTLSHGFFELATACWTWPRGCFELCLYGVATSSWTMSCGYFELVLVLAKLFAAVKWRDELWLLWRAVTSRLMGTLRGTLSTVLEGLFVFSGKPWLRD